MKLRFDKKTHQVSVIDIIRQLTGLKANHASQALKRMVNEMNMCRYIRINGKGRLTPVVPPSLVEKIVKTVLTKTRMSKRAKLRALRRFGITEKPLFMKEFVETETVDVLKRVFSREETKTQLSVLGGKYRIDLAFPERKIAVECDENGHKYGYPQDGKRQKEIENLGYRFVRYNPNAPDFDLSRVVCRIRNMIDKN